MTSTRLKGVTAKKGVPQTPEELNSALGAYFSAKRKLKGLKSRLDERIKKVKDQYGLKMKSISAEVEELKQNITSYSESHRAELTADGTKHAKFSHGTVRWQLGNWTHIVSTSDNDVIAELERTGRGEYVIIDKRLDAQALIRDRDQLGDVEGLSFKREERFYIDPPKGKKA